MNITIISRYVRGKNKQPMAMIVIRANGRSYTRHCAVQSDGSLIGYWPGRQLSRLKAS